MRVSIDKEVEKEKKYKKINVMYIVNDVMYLINKDKKNSLWIIGILEDGGKGKG